MSKSIFKLVDDLPESNLTTRMLSALDSVVPGQYKNLVGFEHTIKVITGETSEDMIQKIGERAVALYNDKKQGYQRAVWLYQTAEGMSNMVGAASLANKAGESWKILRWLNKITPKADKAQAFDFTVKVVIELLAFTNINGIPGDSVGDFLKSLAHYKDEALMRMAALICVDGLLPLGPDYLSKALGALSGSGVKELEKHDTFQDISNMIPGDHAKKIGVMTETVKGVGSWMTEFASKNHLTQDSVLAKIKDFVDVSESKLDYVAAFIDVSTNYYEHTGIQSVARSLIERAVNEI
ncbi:MAG: hypothetical protein U0800_06170 [Isosphaeraceae bacterium]